MAGTEVSARWWAGATTPDTAADKQLYVEIGLAPVTCDRCGTEVLVKKNSSKHTSVQWTKDAVAACPEIAAQVQAGVPAGQVLGCTALKAAIEHAARTGQLTVPGD
jgi:hypothetical protein